MSGRPDLYVPAAEFARWEAERDAELAAERRVPAFDRPLDRLLFGLRATGPASYVCDERPGVWRAYCPACDSRTTDRRTLLVIEAREGGPISMVCRSRCTGEAIYEALRRAEEAYEAAGGRR